MARNFVVSEERRPKHKAQYVAFVGGKRLVAASKDDLKGLIKKAQPVKKEEPVKP